MKKVFSQAALGFGAFGGLVSALSGLSSVSSLNSGTGSSAFNAIMVLCAIVSGIALMFYYLPRYRSNPIDVTPSFVKRAYALLIFTYGTIFYSILKGFSLIGSGGQGTTTALIYGGGLFGATLLIYAIPATIGFLMNKHSRAVSLYKFLGFCYSAYLVLFVISLVSVLFASPTFFASSHFFLSLLCGIIILTTPILSVYRMKTVVRYLDQSDYVAVKKWELFFVFEILAQLMQMALYLARFAFYCCMSCSRK